MKKCAMVFVLLATAGLAQANTLRLSTTAFSVNPGGEFKAEPLTGNAGLTGLPGDLSANSFETFCLEHGENFNNGAVYTFAINTGAVGGGVPGGFDPLDSRTAYLYTYFRNGVLPGFNYGAGRQASSGMLQQAIWFLEGETGGVNNAFVALADAAVLPGGDWFGMGIGNVRVLNLTNSNGERRQDQLTILPPIPTPGAAALAGLGVLAAARRRR